jgi:hypothetical protein
MADPIPTGTIGQSPVFALPREGATASATGFQGAHMFGKDFVGQEGAWLKRLFPGAGAADATWPWNFAQLGETKGTAAANGTSVHAGQDVLAFDALLYDTSGAKTQILNTLETKFVAASANGDQATILKIRQQVIALAYYLKYRSIQAFVYGNGAKEGRNRVGRSKR